MQIKKMKRIKNRAILVAAARRNFLWDLVHNQISVDQGHIWTRGTVNLQAQRASYPILVRISIISV